MEWSESEVQTMQQLAFPQIHDHIYSNLIYYANCFMVETIHGFRGLARYHKTFPAKLS